jgi:vitamin B12 transporter
MKLSLRSCDARRALPAFFMLVALATGRGQTPPDQLEPFVTSATRTASAPQTVGSAVDVFSSADLARRQITSVAQALGGVAGAPLFASGAPGASTSIFLRGANSNQTLFLVDGLRFNDPNTDYNVFLGGATLGACDSLEVAHGPQSTLYGGEAVGGVIALRARAGTSAPTSRVSVEAGSFGTVQGGVAAQGAPGAWAYNFSASGGHTDNARANNAFDRVNTVLRLDRPVNDRTAVGATLRWFRGVYGDPGDRYTNDPDNQEREDNVLATVFADLTLAAAVKSHVVLGGQDRHYVSENPTAGRPTQVTDVRNRRAVLDWQTTFTGLERQRITAGLTAEENHTRNDGFGNIDQRQSLLAFFVQDEVAPGDNVFLTAGLRSDDYDTFGRATTGRATAAWLIADRTLKLRASYGTAFRSPSFLDLYGQSAFYVGNPHLRPEKARGWDAGLDYYLPRKSGTLSVTWFTTNYRDLVVYDFSGFPGTVVNVDRARTRGVELSFTRILGPGTDLRVAYTYLEAENLTAQTRLLRRPRNSTSADLWHDFGAGVSAGVGVVGVAGRQDVDAATFATINARDYTVMRLYAAWQATARLALKLRLENLLGEKYEPVNGYPAPGFGAYGGAEWKF